MDSWPLSSTILMAHVYLRSHIICTTAPKKALSDLQICSVFFFNKWSLSFPALCSNVRFLMIALAYSVPTGVIAGWSGVLDMILTPANINQVRRSPLCRICSPSLHIYRKRDGAKFAVAQRNSQAIVHIISRFTGSRRCNIQTGCHHQMFIFCKLTQQNWLVAFRGEH